MDEAFNEPDLGVLSLQTVQLSALVVRIPLGLPQLCLDALQLHSTKWPSMTKLCGIGCCRKE